LIRHALEKHFSANLHEAQVRQDALDSTIVYAINEALDERVLETFVAAALERLGQKEAQCPDQRTQQNVNCP
jgi:hypothetical protein